MRWNSEEEVVVVVEKKCGLNGRSLLLSLSPLMWCSGKVSNHSDSSSSGGFPSAHTSARVPTAVCVRSLMQRGKLSAASFRLSLHRRQAAALTVPFSNASAAGTVAALLHHQSSQRAPFLEGSDRGMALLDRQQAGRSPSAPSSSTTAAGNGHLAHGGPSTSAEDAEDAVRRSIWRHAAEGGEGWEAAVLARIEKLRRRRPADSAEEGWPLPLWQELVIALLFCGRGESAFRVWQRGSAVGGTGATLRAPTVLALSLYTRLVEGKPDSARDLLLLLPSGCEGSQGSSGGDEEPRARARIAAYVRLLCQGRKDPDADASAEEGGEEEEVEEEKRLKECAQAVALWLLSSFQRQLMHMQAQAHRTYPLPLADAGADGGGATRFHEEESTASGSVALLYLVASAVDGGVSVLADWTPSDAVAAKAWKITKDLTAAAKRVAVAACHHAPEAQDGAAVEGWVSAARAAMREVDPHERGEAHLSFIPNALLTTSIALYRSTEATADVRSLVDTFRLLCHSLTSGSPLAPMLASAAFPTSEGTLASCLLLLSNPRPDADSDSGGGCLRSLISYRGDGRGANRDPGQALVEYTPLRWQRMRIFAEAPLPFPVVGDGEEKAVVARAKAMVCEGVFAVVGENCTGGDGGGGGGRPYHALEALRLLSTLCAAPPPNPARSTAVRPFVEHPLAVEAILEAVAQTQATALRLAKSPRLELACPEWGRFIRRLLGPHPSVSLRLPSAPAIGRDSRSGTVSLPPWAMATLHRTWWLPQCLRLAPGFCHAYERALTSGEQDTRCIAHRAWQQKQRSHANSRKTVVLLCQWAWLLSCLDEAERAVVDCPADAVTLAQAVSRTLDRCRDFHRPDIANDLMEVLLSPVAPTTSNGSGSGGGGTVLSELVRVLRTAAGSAQAGWTAGVAEVVKAVCRWRYDVFPSYAALVEFHAVSTPRTAPMKETPDEAGKGGGAASLFSVLVTEVLCAVPSSSPDDAGSGHARALLAARLLHEGCALHPDHEPLLRSPRHLLLIGRALRSCTPQRGGASAHDTTVSVYSGLLRDFMEYHSTAFPGPFGGKPKAVTAVENGVFVHQQQWMTMMTTTTTRTRMITPSEPVTRSADNTRGLQQAPEALRSEGRGVIAAFAVNYVLALWSWAHDAVNDAEAFAARVRHLSQVLLKPAAQGASREPEHGLPYASADVVLLMSPAEREALRVLFALYMMHYSLSCVPTAFPLSAMEFDNDRGDRGRSGSRLVSAATSAEATAQLLLRRLPPRLRGRAGDAPQLISHRLSRLCRHEAPGLLFVYEPLAQQVARGFTTLHDALVHGVPRQLAPMVSPPSAASSSSSSFPSPSPPSSSSSSSSPPLTSKRRIDALMDAGDWAAALAAIETAFTSPLHRLRKSLGACEAAKPHPGVAWEGALAVWRRARQQHGNEAPPLVGLSEVGRVVTLLAHGRRWQEALRLFNEELTDELVDGYVFSQVAFALRAAGHADAVVGLWARWRCRVGDAVAPTPAMVDAVVGAGLFGSQDVAAKAACLLVKDAVLPPAGEPIPGSDIPLRLSGITENTVQKLLRERWYESWQSALAVAVASGRPALVTTVAQRSPPHRDIYHASTRAMRARRTLKEMDPTQRAALARHAVHPHREPSTHTVARTPREKTSPPPPEAAHRRRRIQQEAEGIEQVLKDLFDE